MFEVVIGLEVHAQLNTKTKIFCSCATSFGEEPNTNVCPTCLALPGALPVLNEEAVKKAFLIAKIIFIRTYQRLIKFRNLTYPSLREGSFLSL